MSFPEVLASARRMDRRLRLSIPPEWHQGRTAYGGFSSALALSAAMEAGGADLPPLRSAQISMIAPLFGDVEVRAKVLRRGKNATWISAEIAGERGVGLTASFVFMGEVESLLHLNAIASPDGLIPVNEAADFAFREHSPAFLRNNFDVRFALPRTGEKEP